VPVKDTVSALSGAVSVTVIDALALPEASGANVTLMAQLLFAAKDEGQLLVCAKSVLLVPVI
jgi:hypothetical protein